MKFPVLTGALMALALLTPLPALASGVVDNVNGITLDGEGRVVRFAGLLISDDGRVEKFLREKDKRPEKLTFRLDGKGRTLIPGFVDAHGHVMELGLNTLTLDLTGAKSLTEAQAMIAAYLREHPGRSWVLGYGWDADAWGLGRQPTAADLDAAVSDIPAWLISRDGHAGWANGKAMAAAGYTAKTPVPQGGRVDGGIFVDKAMALIARVAPQPLAKDRDLAFAKAQQLLLEQGVTTITDMGTTIEDWQTFRRAGDRGALRIRILSYAAGIEQMVTIAGPAPTPWLYDDRLRLVGVKFTLDGALGTRGAWLKAPYADAPTQKGLPQISDTQLRNQLSRAAMDGFQVAVDATGDAATSQLLDAYAEVADSYSGDRRWRVELARVVDPTELPRFGQQGVVAAMPPLATAQSVMATARLGPARAAGLDAWRSISTGKAVLAFGGDTPAMPIAPLSGLAAAMERQGAETLSFDQAFRAYTQGAAYAGFAEDRLGTLQPGRRADFLLLDRDISAAMPAEVRAAKVLESWIGGKRVFVREN